MSREGSEVVLYYMKLYEGSSISRHMIYPLYRRSVRWPSTYFVSLIKRDNGSTILRCIGPSSKMSKPEN